MSEQDANAFVAKMKKLLDGVPREHTEQYVLALAAADFNHDGIISGDELAAAMVKLNEATAPKRIEEWKTGCSHPPIMDKMATNLQWHAAHTLHVLNNDGVDDQSTEIATKEMRIAFLNRYGVKGGLLPIAPEDQKILADGATDMRRARDQRLLDIQDELSSNHMLGQLPTQVAPMTGADLCKALGK